MRVHPFSLKHFSLTLWSDLPLIGPNRRAVAEIQPFITKSELDSQALWREQAPPKGNCPILFSEEMNHHLELLLPLCWLQREPWVTSSVTDIYIIYLIYRFLNVYSKADESHSMSLARVSWGGCCRVADWMWEYIREWNQCYGAHSVSTRDPSPAGWRNKTWRQRISFAIPSSTSLPADFFLSLTLRARSPQLL